MVSLSPKYLNIAYETESIPSLKRSNSIGVRNDIAFLIKVVDERNASRDVKTSDVLLRDLVEVHDKGSQAVAVSSDDDALAGFDFGKNFVLPNGHESLAYCI